MKIRVSLLLICLFFASCSYYPLANLSQDTLPKNVSVKVLINKADPKNSINLADNFTNYLQYFLHKNVIHHASTLITVQLIASDFDALYFDELGFAKSYKASIMLEFIIDYEDGRNSRKIHASGEHIFNTNSISVISEEQKAKAIDAASKKAFDEFALKLIN